MLPASEFSIGINPAFTFSLAPFYGSELLDPATELLGFAPAAIRYRHTDTDFLPAPQNNRVEFVNFGAQNYRLRSTSPYAGAGEGGTDLGADLDAIVAASGVTAWSIGGLPATVWTIP